MKFIIRDDDLNYFSKPDDILRWYEDIFAQKIPLGFATIPFVKGESDVYTGNVNRNNTADTGKEYPISLNTELVSYIKSNPLIEIVQHGCTHETDGVFEYARTTDLSKDTARGKKELENAFGREVKVFSPPHDWIGVSGIRAVESSGLNIIRGRSTGLRNLIFRRSYIKIFLKMLFFKLGYILNKNTPVYPHVLDFGLHKEMCSYRLEDVDVFDGLRYAHRKNGNFVLVTHLHFFDEGKKALLLTLIKKAKECGAEFVLPSQVFV